MRIDATKYSGIARLRQAMTLMELLVAMGDFEHHSCRAVSNVSADSRREGAQRRLTFWRQVGQLWI